MGLLDGKTHEQYYNSNDLGGYQFISLEAIVNQFLLAYVGENKIIPKINKLDVAFHAQRAMQELSFDTFKSIKAQEIVLPPTLVMPLPHDYVNYTNISWSDSSGIKRPLYPTKDTSNPFKILQEDNGQYSFPADTQLLQNRDFSTALDSSTDWIVHSLGSNMTSNYQGHVGVLGGKLTWRYVTKNGNGAYNWSQVPFVFQSIDVSEHDYIDLSANGSAEAITYNETSGGTNTTTSTVRIGLINWYPNSVPAWNINNIQNSTTGYTANYIVNPNQFTFNALGGDAAYLEWTTGESGTKELQAIDVRAVDTVQVLVYAISDFPSSQVYGEAVNGNTIDDISIKATDASTMLQSPYGETKTSTTWDTYKSLTPSENQDDYEDDSYWPHDGRRYGLDPQHAQANGSFFIDQRLGRIHFSSNISGKTVILDYISDSLGTDAEMQVHKFAEEAMYKWIAHAIISTSSYGQQLVPRFKKEKFAAVRQAKLRLSNIKLEELTQILRGKSKQIKH